MVKMFQSHSFIKNDDFQLKWTLSKLPVFQLKSIRISMQNAGDGHIHLLFQNSHFHLSISVPNVSQCRSFDQHDIDKPRIFLQSPMALFTPNNRLFSGTRCEQ